MRETRAELGLVRDEVTDEGAGRSVRNHDSG